jgi:hypothetical protein
MNCTDSIFKQQIVITSEAKQSMVAPQKRKLDCFVATLLAMTARYVSAFPRRDAPELCVKPAPRKTEGVGNAGCPPHP